MKGFPGVINPVMRNGFRGAGVTCVTTRPMGREMGVLAAFISLKKFMGVAKNLGTRSQAFIHPCPTALKTSSYQPQNGS